MPEEQIKKEETKTIPEKKTETIKKPVVQKLNPLTKPQSTTSQQTKTISQENKTKQNLSIKPSTLVDSQPIQKTIQPIPKPATTVKTFPTKTTVTSTPIKKISQPIKKVDANSLSKTAMPKTTNIVKDNNLTQKTKTSNQVQQTVLTKTQSQNVPKKTTPVSEPTVKPKIEVQKTIVKPATKAVVKNSPPATKKSDKEKIVFPKTKLTTKIKMLTAKVIEKVKSKIKILVVLGIIIILLTAMVFAVIKIKNYVQDKNASKKNVTEKNVTEKNVSNQTQVQAIKKIPKIEKEEREETIFKSYSLIENYTEEKITLERKNRKLNIGENITDVFAKEIEDDYLPIFLKENENIEEYKRKIILSDELQITNFSDNDYLDGENTSGFELSNNDFILKYEIIFKSGITWEELEDEDIIILGQKYKIVDASEEKQRIILYKNPLDILLKENEIVQFKTSVEDNISILFMNENSVVMDINSKKTDKIERGELHENDVYLAVWSVFPPETKRSGMVDFTISKEKIILQNNYIKNDDEIIDGLNLDFDLSSEGNINKISIEWEVKKEKFLTSETTLTIPFFETLRFSMSDRGVDLDEKYYWEVYLNAKTYDYEWVAVENKITNPI